MEELMTEQVSLEKTEVVGHAPPRVPGTLDVSHWGVPRMEGAGSS